MKEHKFRAWDEAKKRMYYFDLFDLDDHYSYVDGEPISENAIITEYIGLKDKNGQKIYEGDIVSNEERTCFGEIQYYDISPHAEFGIQWHDDDLTLWWDNEIDEELEIIGNIYENPKLLDKSK